MRYCNIDKFHLWPVRVMAIGTLPCSHCTRSAVSSFLPCLVASLMALGAERVSHQVREQGTIDEVQAGHISGIMARPAGFITRAQLIMKGQGLLMTLQTIKWCR